MPQYEYWPLTEDGDKGYQPDALAASADGVKYRRLLYLLLAANIVMWLFGFWKLEGIYRQLERSVDIQDTRALLRPDPLYGLTP